MFKMSDDVFYKQTPRRIIAMMNAHKSINTTKEQSNTNKTGKKPPVQKITHLGKFLMSKA